MAITVNNFLINGIPQSNTNIEDTIFNRNPKDYVPSTLEDNISDDDTVKNANRDKANNVHRHHFSDHSFSLGRPTLHIKRIRFDKRVKFPHLKSEYFRDMINLAIPGHHLKIMYKKDEVTNKTFKSTYEQFLEE